MREPIIVFTIDDGTTTDYENVYPMFKKRGLKATSYIIGSFPETGSSVYMGWEYIKALRNKGWDIQCHSYTHRYMGQLDETELNYEMTENDKVFNEQGFGSVEHHCYPYGSHSELSKTVFEDYRKTARHTGKQITTYEEIVSKPLNVKACNMDIQDDVTYEMVKGKIDEVSKMDNGVLVFYFHRVRTHSQISIQESYLEKVVDYVISKGIAVKTFDEMFNHVHKYV